MRLLCWNVATRAQQLPQQVQALAERAPDIVALQEVPARTRPRWQMALAELGLPHILSSLDQPASSDATFGPPPARSGVLLASHWPLDPLPPPAVPWPACVQSALLHGPHGHVEVHTVHVPTGGSYREAKVQTLHALYTAFAQPAPHPRILCGDFNAPKDEYPDGRVTYWGPRRQQAAEEMVLRGLAAFDLTDAYRRLHGYARPAASWVAMNRGRPFPYRLDHLLASACLGPLRCEYLDPWRTRGLSDHAPLEADFAPPP